jgi:hypothetical protein
MSPIGIALHCMSSLFAATVLKVGLGVGKNGNYFPRRPHTTLLTAGGKRDSLLAFSVDIAFSCLQLLTDLQ